MKQEDMLEKIRKSAEEMLTPEGLKPEQMMKKAMQKKKKPGKIYQYGAIAAIFTVTVIAWNQIQEIGTKTPMSSFSHLSSELEREPSERDMFTYDTISDLYVKDRVAADHYNQIYDEIQKLAEGNPHMAEMGEQHDADTGNAYAQPESAQKQMLGAPSAKANQSITNEPGFSTTNSQVDGVDEGDTVKTDGSYIYIASAERGMIRIIKADGAQLSVVSAIDTEADSLNRIEEFYVYGDFLSVIRCVYNASYVGSVNSSVIVETYDISDKSSPKSIGTVSQDGDYRSSRQTEGFLYLFTDFQADIGASREETDRYIPKVEGNVLPSSDILLPELITQCRFVVISALQMSQPDQPYSQKAVMSGGDQFYVSQGNVYIGSGSYDRQASQYDDTELIKLSYEKGLIQYKARGSVDGYLNNQFSMDEYEGHLRVVSTLSHRGGMDTNSLFVLDDGLKVIGEIGNLAPDEQIYSARFMEDTAYFVTYRNMDPLFSVDLSNPRQPKVLGELKITGFSEYLHPYQEGLLLGIGQETNPSTGNFEGLKLSMFDISSPIYVEEIQKTVETSYEYSPAWDNHKAVLISAEHNLIGFGADIYDRTRRDWGREYVIYAYDDEKGFVKQLNFVLESGDTYSSRGIYINKWFYIAEPDKVTVFSLDGFEQLGTLSF